MIAMNPMEERKTLFTSTPKDFIPSLPRFTFEGKIVVIQSQREAIQAVKALKNEPVLGMDTETKPAFKKGQHHQVALLQISGNELCFLFRLNMTGLLPCLVDLLSDHTQLKVGLALRDDFKSLQQRQPFEPGRHIEIQRLAEDIGLKDMSLQKLYANLFHQRISKQMRLSNWEANVLTDAQKTYAATDAFSCIQLYRELIRLKESGLFELIPPEIP